MSHGPDDELVATSRVCVKNIPKYVNEARLKEHFSTVGEITDAKVVRTKDGTSRQLAFIGYRSVEQAAEALRFFNRSYMDTLRLTVEFARKVGDLGGARAWSKYSEGSSRYQEAHAVVALQPDELAADKKEMAAKQGRNKKSKLEEAAKKDPQLAEFLALMAPRSKGVPLWADDKALTRKHAAAAPGNGEEPGGNGEEPGGNGEEPGGDGRVDGMDGGAGTKGWAQKGENKQGDVVIIGGKVKVAVAGGKAVNNAKGAGDNRIQGVKVQGAGDQMGVDEELESEGEEDGVDPLVGKDAAVTDEHVSDLDYIRARVKTFNDSEEEEEKGDRQQLRQASEEEEEDEEEEDGYGEGEGRGGGRRDDDEERDGEETEQVDLQDECRQWGNGARAVQRGDQRGVSTSHGRGDVQEDGEAGEALVCDTGRLFVRNLPFSATEDDLRSAFAHFGELEEVHLVLDRGSRSSRGIAYVRYRVPEDAVRAWRDMDGAIFMGRLLHVLPAQRQHGAGVGGDGGAASGEDGGAGQEEGAVGPGSSFKRQRDAQRKAEAGSNRAAWNSLFMRADTVAAAVAEHFGVSRAELLSRDAADLPVRLALGEAHVISATKQALAHAGVDVIKLEEAAAAAGHAASRGKSVTRSTTALLVKNLPYSATEGELYELFASCGTVSRLVLPGTRTLALVEFEEPQDARSAFKRLAYKRYHHVPLYLEWAPKRIFDGPPRSSAPATAAAGAPAEAAQEEGKQDGQAVATAKVAEEGASAVVAAVREALDDDDGSAGAGGAASIFVKNLSFSTDDKALRGHFAAAAAAAPGGGALHSVRVVMRSDARVKDGTPLSAGFGFVECSSEALARALIHKLQGSVLDGHSLTLQLSKARRTGQRGGVKPGGAGAGAAAQAEEEAAAAASHAAQCKLVVRNVAFEATRKDIAALFSPFGHVRSCRLPKKFDGTHRGFAFLEFLNKKEAKDAVAGLAGTHLYGRRLVVEYANEVEGLTELRSKAAAQLRSSSADYKPNKKLRI